MKLIELAHMFEVGSANLQRARQAKAQAEAVILELEPKVEKLQAAYLDALTKAEQELLTEE